MQDMSRSDAFAELARRGAAAVKVHFSGGGDEGGADSVVVLDAEGNELDQLNSDVFTPTEWDPETRTYKVTGPPSVSEHTRRPEGGWDHNLRPATEKEIVDAALCRVLEGPLDEYGSWAFEGSVEGTLTWDITARTCVKSASHQEWTEYEESEV